MTLVRATRGKWLRADPVAALHAQGRVRHVGALPELEDELRDFGPDGGSRPTARRTGSTRLSQAITALLLGPEGERRVRGT